MSVFRRSARVPSNRAAGMGTLTDLADLTDPAAVDALLVELDELRATVYRQANQLRESEERSGLVRAAARAEEHRRVLVAVTAMTALAAADPAAPAEVAAFATRIEAAVARLGPAAGSVAGPVAGRAAGPADKR